MLNWETLSTTFKMTSSKGLYTGLYPLPHTQTYEKRKGSKPAAFPYIPGLMAFLFLFERREERGVKFNFYFRRLWIITFKMKETPKNMALINHLEH